MRSLSSKSSCPHPAPLPVVGSAALVVTQALPQEPGPASPESRCPTLARLLPAPRQPGSSGAVSRFSWSCTALSPAFHGPVRRCLPLFMVLYGAVSAFHGPVRRCLPGVLPPLPRSHPRVSRASLGPWIGQTLGRLARVGLPSLAGAGAAWMLLESASRAPCLQYATRGSRGSRCGRRKRGRCRLRAGTGACAPYLATERDGGHDARRCGGEKGRAASRQLVRLVNLSAWRLLVNLSAGEQDELLIVGDAAQGPSARPAGF